MKVIYRYDSDTKIFQSCDTAADDYSLSANETLVGPEPGTYQPMKFDGEKWVGTSKEDWIDNQMQLDNITDQQKFNANILLQLAALRSKNGSN
ncbi:hypothetical protein [Liquorilactobacillus uvarum]|nr:hypothetical protein [Liquorilactobacillus uvarum]